MDQLFVGIKTALLSMLGTFMPDWLVTVHSVLISATGIAIFGPLTMMYLTLIERKVVARMQNRLGPNRVGKFGLLQPVADGIKMLTKEDIVPYKADKLLHLLAPITIVVPALMVFAVLPFGRGMIAADLNVGILYFLAVSSTTTISIFIAGWGSHNKFALLGAMRAVAQMVSYEVPMVLSLVPALMIAGSLSTGAIVAAQAERWFAFTPWGFVAFIIFYLCGVAEVNRSPFDLAEAESEIVAGFHTEYSGMKFALFYMAEFMNTFTISALAATIFLGGWHGPFLPSWFWFLLKTYILIFVMIWFRGTLPRLRIDQLMGLAWKFLLPMALVNVVVAGFWYMSSGVIRTFGSIACLVVAFMVLTALNRPYVPEKREYTFAEN